MEWVVKLEAKNGWGEVETIEVATIKRRVVGPTAEEVGVTLAEGKDLLGNSGTWCCRRRWRSTPHASASAGFSAKFYINRTGVLFRLVFSRRGRHSIFRVRL